MINIFKFIIGSVLGSFISLVSIRIYRNESVVFPPSHCDYCNHQLRPWELIPIISYVALRGRCQKCHHLIDPSIFITELSGAIIAMVNSLTLLGSLNFLIELLLLLLSVCDFKQLSIPILPTIVLAITSLVYVIVGHQTTLITTLTSLTIYLVVTIINSHKQFIGSGDVDVIFILVLVTGWQDLAIIILLASLSALIYYCYSYPSKVIPFIPFISLSYLIISEIKRLVII